MFSISLHNSNCDCPNSHIKAYQCPHILQVLFWYGAGHISYDANVGAWPCNNRHKIFYHIFHTNNISHETRLISNPTESFHQRQTEWKQHQVQTTLCFMLWITTIIRSEINKMKIHYKRTKQLHYEKIKHGQCERVKVIESKWIKGSKCSKCLVGNRCVFLPFKY